MLFDGGKLYYYYKSCLMFTNIPRDIFELHGTHVSLVYLCWALGCVQTS